MTRVAGLKGPALEGRGGSGRLREESKLELESSWKVNNMYLSGQAGRVTVVVEPVIVTAERPSLRTLLFSSNPSDFSELTPLLITPF